MTKLLAAMLTTLPILASSQARAETPFMVNPAVNARPGAPGGENVNSSKEMVVRLKTSCFGMNLRASTNPISPQSLVTANFSVSIRATPTSTPVTRKFFVKFPGELVTKGQLTDSEPGAVDAEYYGGTDDNGNKLNGLKMALYGNTVQLTIPPASANLSLDENGNVIPVQVTVAKPTFEQKVLNCDDMTPVYGRVGYSSHTPTYACGAFMAKDGPVSNELKSMSVSSSGTSVELSVAFPGQTGFCGSFWSPLMVFFDDERPHFVGSSPFRLSTAGLTYWVEPNAPGFFLAFDRNGNGRIDDKTELFGDQDGEGSGFDSLNELDSNKDGVIDGKDRKFGKLLLWGDKNGDGVSQADELQSAKKAGITKISLAYKRNHKSYGETAEARQSSEFTFRRGGKTMKGIVEDVWFAPVPGSAGKQ